LRSVKVRRQILCPARRDPAVAHREGLEEQVLVACDLPSEASLDGLCACACVRVRFVSKKVLCKEL
jgi:hypothetical protein